MSNPAHSKTYSPNIKVMMDAVLKAARGLKRDFGEVENLQVSPKGPYDYVTNADLAAEKSLIASLQRARPEYGILSEEKGEIQGNGEYRFIIDPLDGTANFIHGLPYFCTTVGLERTKEGGKPEIIAGVTYDPILDEMYWAEKGSGAYCNDRRLRVSARRNLDKSMIAAASPNARVSDAKYFTGLQKIASQSFGVRCSGSAALDMAYVAAGRFDAFYRINIKPWDVAAGIILIREAGGISTEIGGGENVIYGENLLAGNEAIHKSIDKVLV